MKDRLKSQMCSRFFKALSDPERLKILQCLQSGPRSVGQVAQQIGSPLPNISHHLRQMRTAGLVSSRKNGREVFYSISRKVMSGGTSLNVLDFGCCRIELNQLDDAESRK